MTDLRHELLAAVDVGLARIGRWLLRLVERLTLFEWMALAAILSFAGYALSR